MSMASVRAPSGAAVVNQAPKKPGLGPTGFHPHACALRLLILSAFRSRLIEHQPGCVFKPRTAIAQ